MAKKNNNLKETVPTKAEEKEIEQLIEEQKEIPISVCAYCSSDITSTAEIKQETKKFDGEDITVYVAKCGNCAANNTQNSPNLVAYQDDEGNTLEVKYGDLG